MVLGRAHGDTSHTAHRIKKWLLQVEEEVEASSVPPANLANDSKDSYGRHHFRRLGENLNQSTLEQLAKRKNRPYELTFNAQGGGVSPIRIGGSNVPCPMLPEPCEFQGQRVGPEVGPRRKRQRHSPSDSSFLENAPPTTKMRITGPTLESTCEAQASGHLHREHSEGSQIMRPQDLDTQPREDEGLATKYSYKRRPRRKTRPDLYEPKSRQPRKTEKPRRYKSSHSRRSRKRKGFPLPEIRSEHVSADRMTVRVLRL